MKKTIESTMLFVGIIVAILTACTTEQYYPNVDIKGLYYEYEILDDRFMGHKFLKIDEDSMYLGHRNWGNDDPDEYVIYFFSAPYELSLYDSIRVHFTPYTWGTIGTPDGIFDSLSIKSSFLWSYKDSTLYSTHHWIAVDWEGLTYHSNFKPFK